MRIESVTALAFGPFVKETLDLAPGFTVVHGDNESGKSTWHAATYAALCGRRRGKGALRKEDDEFREQRRPWGGDCWQVRCIVVLDDGRRVELWHDLDALVDCGAKDLVLGDDLASEIMYDGAPDGSKWLGLNRRTFAATAVVDQADLSGVVRSAELLQQDLQRAAATAGKDQTAASALAALKEFRSARVGRDQTNSRRPLRAAIDAEKHATGQLSEARTAHAEYLELLATAETAKQEAAAAGGERQRVEGERRDAARLVELARDARLAGQRAAELDQRATELAATADRGERRLERARQLSTEIGDEEPPGGRSDDELARSVTGALAGWRAAPELPTLHGPTVAELEAELAVLPADPGGEVAPQPEVQRLRSALDEATAVLHSTNRRARSEPDVTDPQLAAACAAGPEVVRRLADRLTEPEPRVDTDLVAERDAAAAELTAARAELATAEDAEAAAVESVRRGSRGSRGSPGPASAASVRTSVASLVVGGVLGVTGLVLLLLSQPAVGVVLLALGIAAVAGGVALRRRVPPPAAATETEAETPLSQAREHLRAARERASRSERVFADANARAEAAATDLRIGTARRQAAASEASQRKLPADAEALHRLAAQVADISSERAAFDSWARDHDSDQRAQADATQRLSDVLERRGYDCSAGVLAACSAYERDCAQASEQAQLAARRPELSRRLAERQDAEHRLAAALAARCSAVAELVTAARTTGATGLGEVDADPADLAAALQRWLDKRTAALEAVDERRAHWQELQALLDGATLAQLTAAVTADAAGAESARAAAEQALDRWTAKQADCAATAAAMKPGPVDEEQARRWLAEQEAALATLFVVQQEASEQAAAYAGQVAERGDRIPSVAEAEEALERAVRELRRVRDLDRVLELTSRYLQQAQNDVFLDIAPVLGSTLTRWLPRLTGGRYTEALVHPQNLRVQVRDAAGQWREANLLSVGTAEQVYLLLRLALAEHLASKSTVSPLLLDDVTVQADPRRSVAILEMCKALADDGRQVVLFAQEPAVADWAAQHLDGEDDQLIRLEVLS